MVNVAGATISNGSMTLTEVSEIIGVDTALKFDGSNDVVYVAHNNIWLTAPQTWYVDFTVDILPSVLGVTGNLFDKASTHSPTKSPITCYISSSNNYIYLQCREQSSVAHIIVSNAAVVAGQRYRLFVTLSDNNPSTMKMFIDGVQQSSTTTCPRPFTPYQMTNLGIGAENTSEYPSAISLYAIKMWTKELSSGERSDVDNAVDSLAANWDIASLTVGDSTLTDLAGSNDGSIVGATVIEGITALAPTNETIPIPDNGEFVFSNDYSTITGLTFSGISDGFISLHAQTNLGEPIYQKVSVDSAAKVRFYEKAGRIKIEKEGTDRKAEYRVMFEPDSTIQDNDFLYFPAGLYGATHGVVSFVKKIKDFDGTYHHTEAKIQHL